MNKPHLRKIMQEYRAQFDISIKLARSHSVSLNNFLQKIKV